MQCLVREVVNFGEAPAVKSDSSVLREGLEDGPEAVSGEINAVRGAARGAQEGKDVLSLGGGEVAVGAPRSAPLGRDGVGDLVDDFLGDAERSVGPLTDKNFKSEKLVTS